MRGIYGQGQITWNKDIKTLKRPWKSDHRSSRDPTSRRSFHSSKAKSSVKMNRIGAEARQGLPTNLLRNASFACRAMGTILGARREWSCDCEFRRGGWARERKSGNGTAKREAGRGARMFGSGSGLECDFRGWLGAISGLCRLALLMVRKLC